jgi:hypothetical protein
LLLGWLACSCSLTLHLPPAGPLTGHRCHLCLIHRPCRPCRRRLCVHLLLCHPAARTRVRLTVDFCTWVCGRRVWYSTANCAQGGALRPRQCVLLLRAVQEGLTQPHDAFHLSTPTLCCCWPLPPVCCGLRGGGCCWLPGGVVLTPPPVQIRSAPAFHLMWSHHRMQWAGLQHTLLAPGTNSGAVLLSTPCLLALVLLG